MLEFDGTLLIIIISFVIFIFVMQKIFYAPVTEVRNERRNYIDKNLEFAQKARNESVRLTKDYEIAVSKAKIEASNIVSASTLSAGKEKTKILEDTSKIVNNKINQEKEMVLKDKNNAIETLKPQIISLAHFISAKILGEEVPMSGTTQEMINNVVNR